MQLSALFGRSAKVSAQARRAGWSYEEAFARNIGLVTGEEQALLREACVAIAGMGGVGGIHAVTFARAGVGRFRIADPDTFEVANFNRQYGATTEFLGRNKADAMASVIREINPEAEIRVFSEGVSKENIAEFLEGADLFVDGVDFFAVGLRRWLFRVCHERGIWAITAGPVGFGVAWLVFSPHGMSAEEYFDFSSCGTYLEALIAFALGLAPRGLHLAYFDRDAVDVEQDRAPSFGGACQLCAGVAAIEGVKILVGRGRVWPAPYYQQFDGWTSRYVRGRLRFGNRGPLQRLKRAWALRQALQRYPHLRGLNRPF